MSLEIEKQLILDLCAAQDYLPMKQLSSRYECTERTIRSYMALLRDYGIETEYRRNYGYVLLNREKAFEVLKHFRDEEGFTYEQRIIAEMTVLLSSSEYTSLNDLSEMMYISRTAAKNDMEEIRKRLEAMNMPVIVNVHGHKIPLSSYERLLILLSCIDQSTCTVEQTGEIFRFVFGCDFHREVFRACIRNLIDYKLNVSDDDCIRYVNYLVLAEYFEKYGSALCQLNTDAQSHKAFGSLKKDIQNILSLDGEKWKQAEYVYQLLILKKPDEKIRKDAQEIVMRFADLCSRRYGFIPQENDISVLKEAVSDLLINEHLFISERPVQTDEIMRQYSDGYVIALGMKDFFEQYGYHFHTESAARIALYLNQALTRYKDSVFSKIRLILINTHGQMDQNYLIESIKDTVDPRNYEMESLNLYTFNETADSYNPLNTVMIATEPGCIETCEEKGLSYLIVNRILYGKDIESIREMISTKKREYRRSILTQHLEDAEEVMDLKIRDNEKASYEDAEHVFALSSGILAVQLKEKKNHIDVIVYEKTFMYGEREIMAEIRYGFVPDGEKGRSVFEIRTAVLKNAEGSELRKCSTKDELISLIRTYIQ